MRLKSRSTTAGPCASRDEPCAIQALSRGGHTLVEALCALALSGILAATAALALGGARRSMAAMDALTSAARSSREAVAVTAALMRDADSVEIHDDTAASLAILVALGPICAIEPSGHAVFTPPAAVVDSAPLFSRSQAVEPGDIASILMVDSVARSAHWISTVVDSVTERVAPSPCGVAEGWLHPGDAGAVRLRLALRDALPAHLQVGAPLRLTRRGRLVLYHAGSGDWMLGWRRCDASGTACGAVQPITGPLRSPGMGGWGLRSDGTTGVHVRALGLPPSRGDSVFVQLAGTPAP